MKNTIINILIFILVFNIMMIIFPEGKTQKYCKLIIKIFIIIYIINNIFFKGIFVLDDIVNSIPKEDYSYQREINIKNVNKEFIDLFNKNNYEEEEVIKDIVLNFTDDMNIKAVVTINKYLSYEEITKLKATLAEIFKINTQNIEVDRWKDTADNCRRESTYV